MKLYSRTQLLLFAGLCVVVAFLLAYALGFVQAPQQRAEASIADVADKADQMERISIQFNDAGSVDGSSEYSDNEKENILIYKRFNEAVVNITSISFSYNWFLEPVPQEGTGSGSIIDATGIVLTNYHVIKGAKELQVTLADGADYRGEVIGVDPENDLAVIKFDPRGKVLAIIPLGTSSDLLVGQKVVAIGNPFALQRTLTTGVVSGLGRPIKTREGVVIKEMIQTDASINPGNSGGPLLNSRGFMIGINTMIYSPSGGSVGIGFAVPVDTAHRILPDLMKYGEVLRGWIDIKPVQLFPQLVRYGRLPTNRGILVSEVEAGGFAEAAGIKGGNRNRAVRAGRDIIYLGGDIIVEVDSTPVDILMDLYSALEDNKPGDAVDVVVIRGTARRTFQVTLAERSR